MLRWQARTDNMQHVVRIAGYRSLGCAPAAAASAAAGLCLTHSVVMQGPAAPTESRAAPQSPAVPPLILLPRHLLRLLPALLLAVAAAASIALPIRPHLHQSAAVPPPHHHRRQQLHLGAAHWVSLVLVATASPLLGPSPIHPQCASAPASQPPPAGQQQQQQQQQQHHHLILDSAAAGPAAAPR